MNAISLEARKRMIAENLSVVDDFSVIEQIEDILKIGRASCRERV